MPTYRIDVPYEGRPILLQDGNISSDVIFKFDNCGVQVFNEIANHGIRALNNNPDLAHLLNAIEGKSLKAIHPNYYPNQHFLIFG